MSTRVLVPSGVLGLGFDSAALQAGLTRNPDIICIDGGSTDSGPYYLGTGSSKYSHSSTLAEWSQLVEAATSRRVPLVLGSAGTCGTDRMVDWMVELTGDIANRLGVRLKVATIKSSQDSGATCRAFENGRVTPLSHAPDISTDDFGRCSNIVALAGAEQVQMALETDADIIIAGRATDTAAIAALPLLNGNHPGGAWHGAKIGECGALCSTNPLSGVIEIEFDRDGCSVEPLATNAQCTPQSVCAHMLYENADPNEMVEPGGVLDARDATYIAESTTRVRIEGSRWIPSDGYTVKLEGAGLAGYQAMTLVILRDRHYVRNARNWVARLQAFLAGEIGRRTGMDQDAWQLEFRLIGIDAALGSLETGTALPNEVGVMCIVTADSQISANEIAKLANPFLLHFPLSETGELPSFAFPFSPAETERGPIYEFLLNHVLELDHPMDAFRLNVLEVGNGPAW